MSIIIGWNINYIFFLGQSQIASSQYISSSEIQGSLADITDGNTSSCISFLDNKIPLKQPRFARFILPVHFSGKQNITITGTNFKCSDFKNDGPAIHLPVDPANHGLFGEYKKCDLITGSTTSCAFSCDCGNETCLELIVSAARVEDFTVSPWSICEVTWEYHSGTNQFYIWENNTFLFNCRIKVRDILKLKWCVILQKVISAIISAPQTWKWKH